MSDLPDYLDYQGELVDDEPLLTVQYSQQWLKFLLSVLDVLRDSSLYAPGVDVDDVMQQVDELGVRLMGGEYVGGGMNLPYVCPASALRFFAVTNPGKEFDVAFYWLRQRQYTDSTDANQNMCAWEVYLEAGNYACEVLYSKGPNRAKFTVAISPGTTIIGATDAYAATLSYSDVVKGLFEVTEDQTYSFQVTKLLKNPASSGAYVVFEGVIVRKIEYGET